VIEDAPVEELQRLLAMVDILEPLPPEELERLALLSSSMRLKEREALALDEYREASPTGKRAGAGARAWH
jgi:hypothetical protein